MLTQALTNSCWWLEDMESRGDGPKCYPIPILHIIEKKNKTVPKPTRRTKTAATAYRTVRRSTGGAAVMAEEEAEKKPKKGKTADKVYPRRCSRRT